MACHGNCWKDRDTGETFCTWLGVWVDICPHDDLPTHRPEEDEEPEQDEDE